MAMNGTQLGDDIVAFLKTLNPEIGTGTPAETKLKQQWEGIAGVIVSHIQANAVVNTNDTGTVTSGPGSGGAVVATGVGTVT